MVEIVDVENARYELATLEEERHNTEPLPTGDPLHICDTHKSPLIHYVAYNHAHLVGLIVGHNGCTSETRANLFFLSDLDNVNGEVTFGQQFHRNVPYSETPLPGTWHWIEGLG